MSEKLNTAVAVMGIDIGKNSFHPASVHISWAVGSRRLPSRSGTAACWRAAFPPGRATTFVATQSRREHQGLSRRSDYVIAGSSFCAAA